MFSLVGLLFPSKSVRYNKTYDTLEFISPGDETRSISDARSWCKQHGSTLAEITSEYIWNRTLEFVDEFRLNTVWRSYLILNANGKELPAWQWVTGKKSSDVDSHPLGFDGEMYGRLSKIGNQNLSITKSSPNCWFDCSNGYVCEHPGDWSCNTQSSNSIPLNGNCYVFHHDESISWFEAYFECYKNDGRLATFKNIKKEEASIAQQLKHGRKYWIGLYRYEWRWADSNELLGFSNWGTSYPYREDHCMNVDLSIRKWYTTDCGNSYNFFFLKDVTKCVSNLCRNNATCFDVDNNYTCQCAPGFTRSHWKTQNANECGDGPCRNGATCFDSDKDYICSCANGSTGLECQTGSSQIVEPPVPDMTMTLIKVVVVTAIVFLILNILVICVRKKIKARKSNDAELASRYETRNASLLDNHIYSVINISDNIGDARKLAGQKSLIYEPVD